MNDSYLLLSQCSM